MCGEQPPWRLFQGCRLGSPPRVRGTVQKRQPTRGFPRITPACAGNRFADDVSTNHNRDHPRVCGEQGNLGHYRRFSEGSPPRVRGTVKLSEHEAGLLRITPACAGNRVLTRNVRNGSRDHPRVCGEQGVDQLSAALVQGSPPRVRGTGIEGIYVIMIAWITPACAGNSVW